MGAEPNFYQHISHSSCTLKWIKCSLPFRILFMSSESAFGHVIVITVEQALTLSVNVCSNKGSEYSHYTVIMQQREKLNSCLKYSLGGAFPGGPPLKNPPAIQETWVSIPGPRSPWRKAWQPTPVFLPGESHGLRSLVGYRPSGHKGSDMTEVTERSTAHSTCTGCRRLNPKSIHFSFFLFSALGFFNHEYFSFCFLIG